jgi:hypothetical protein
METEKMFGSFSPTRKGTNFLRRKGGKAPCFRAFWRFQVYKIGVPKNPRNAYLFADNPPFSFSASLALIQKEIERGESLETLDLSGLARFVSDNPASSRRLPHQCQSCHLLTLLVESHPFRMSRQQSLCDLCIKSLRNRDSRVPAVSMATPSGSA